MIETIHRGALRSLRGRAMLLIGYTASQSTDFIGVIRRD